MGRNSAWGYTQRLLDAGIVPNPGRTGTALDNAMSESVIATIKTELAKKHLWRTRLDHELALLTYIGWYKHATRHPIGRLWERLCKPFE